jgi:hypothetical protein
MIRKGSRKPKEREVSQGGALAEDTDEIIRHVNEGGSPYIQVREAVEQLIADNQFFGKELILEYKDGRIRISVRSPEGEK